MVRCAFQSDFTQTFYLLRWTQFIITHQKTYSLQLLKHTCSNNHHLTLPLIFANFFQMML